MPARWLQGYQSKWLGGDVVAGITLAAYAVPVSLAYAGLAGLPPQVGLYGYLLGGIGYALLGSSRHLAVGPTSAISLMVATTVAQMASGDMVRYAQIAQLAALVVAGLSLIAWLFRLSALTSFISETILLGFKAGAGLSIASTQLPALLGVPGGGDHFIERVWIAGSQLGDMNWTVALVGLAALALILLGERFLPGRPIALFVVVLSIVVVSVTGLQERGLVTVGAVPGGLPGFQWPGLRVRDVDGLVPLALGILLLAYIEGVSAARTFAEKHDYPLDPRKELLGLAAANLATGAFGGYAVAGGLSQSAVNDGAGARTPLALVFASITLALCLLYLTSFLESLPKAVLAAVVLTAILGLFDFPALIRMWRISRIDFYAAAIALAAVLLLGILQGILLAALASILLLLIRASRPHVAFLGRVPGTASFSDMDRHPENEPLKRVIAFRPEASLVYVNTDYVLEAVLDHLRGVPSGDIRLVVCDLSASPNMDLAASRMLHELHGELVARGIAFRIVGAHSRVRDLLRADGVGDKVGGLHRTVTLDTLLAEAGSASQVG